VVERNQDNELTWQAPASDRRRLFLDALASHTILASRHGIRFVKIIEHDRAKQHPIAFDQGEVGCRDGDGAKP
jgi:hypothetical protein